MVKKASKVLSVSSVSTSSVEQNDVQTVVNNSVAAPSSSDVLKVDANEQVAVSSGVPKRVAKKAKAPSKSKEAASVASEGTSSFTSNEVQSVAVESQLVDAPKVKKNIRKAPETSLSNSSESQTGAEQAPVKVRKTKAADAAFSVSTSASESASAAASSKTKVKTPKPIVSRVDKDASSSSSNAVKKPRVKKLASVVKSDAAASTLSENDDESDNAHLVDHTLDESYVKSGLTADEKLDMMMECDSNLSNRKMDLSSIKNRIMRWFDGFYNRVASDIDLVDPSSGGKIQKVSVLHLKRYRKSILDGRKKFIQLIRRLPKKNKKVRSASNQSGFMKPVPISNDMANFLGWNPEQNYSRIEVTKGLWQYVKSNKLQNQSKKTEIILNDALRELLKNTDYDPSTPLTCFTIQRYINHHYPKPSVDAQRV